MYLIACICPENDPTREFASCSKMRFTLGEALAGDEREISAVYAAGESSNLDFPEQSVSRDVVASRTIEQINASVA